MNESCRVADSEERLGGYNIYIVVVEVPKLAFSVSGLFHKIRVE